MSAPLPERPAIVIVVPTYNERPNLAALIAGVLAQGPEYRLLIVDDSSPDGTGQLADELAATHPGRIDVLHRPTSPGSARRSRCVPI